MKILRMFLCVFASSAFAMDGEVINVKGYDTLSIGLSQKSESLQALIRDLQLQCTGYFQYLDHFFGCGLCRCANSVFNKEAYQHIENRKLLAENLMMLLDVPAGGVEMLRNLLETIKFENVFGKNFRFYCITNVNSFSPPIERKAQSLVSGGCCAICLDKPINLLLYPCRHLKFANHAIRRK